MSRWESHQLLLFVNHHKQLGRLWRVNTLPDMKLIAKLLIFLPSCHMTRFYTFSSPGSLHFLQHSCATHLPSSGVISSSACHLLGEKQSCVIFPIPAGGIGARFIRHSSNVRPTHGLVGKVKWFCVCYSPGVLSLCVCVFFICTGGRGNPPENVFLFICMYLMNKQLLCRVKHRLKNRTADASNVTM